ncbi:hypothetical protein L873DRAFT_590765 [Choiromyces venosus 120613-1]|uniref:Uncharacterized protein n=1 Tax=Choiromyces venosus 120613-1 TaxID=1336337 RepID=A0A3N4IUA9_9PEZI|nr:hypothetical protein L873DRAFT_590765 [Choiromyces venosus 120613-1]
MIMCDIISCAVCNVCNCILQYYILQYYTALCCASVRETGSPDEGNPDRESGGLISEAVQKENAVADEGVESPSCPPKETQRPPAIHLFVVVSSGGEDPRKQWHCRPGEIAMKRRSLVRYEEWHFVSLIMFFFFFFPFLVAILFFLLIFLLSNP